MSLPLSLRTASSEQMYQEAKEAGTLIPLDEEKRLHEFDYWYVIKNRFPYDAVYSVCDMLIPKRADVANRGELSMPEMLELNQIIKFFCNPYYHQIVENMDRNRSVKSIYHLHLLKFVDSREEMRL